MKPVIRSLAQDLGRIVDSYIRNCSVFYSDVDISGEGYYHCNEADFYAAYDDRDAYGYTKLCMNVGKSSAIYKAYKALEDACEDFAELWESFSLMGIDYIDEQSAGICVEFTESSSELYINMLRRKA